MIDRLARSGLRSLRNRLQALVGRCVIAATRWDGAGHAEVQARLLAGELRSFEMLQPYGWNSRPLPGAEGVVVCAQGNRDHTLAVVVGDRRYRIKDLAEGEMGMQDDQGTRVVFRRDGLLEVSGDDLDAQITADGTIQIGGNLEQTVGGDADETVSGALTRVVGSLDSTTQGTETRLTTGALTWTLGAAATFTVTGTLTLVAAAIQLGTGTLRRLIDERFKVLFDGHVHTLTGGPQTSAPTEAIDLDDHATTATKAN